jgi:3-phosphoshikimate 1-carboxyvinyltransferase
MIINGTQRLMGAEVKTYGDHRMGMMLALAGGFAEGETKIDNIDCINVSNPVFFELLEKLINN